MKNLSLRFRYWFDNLMAKGNSALPLWLFIATEAAKRRNKVAIGCRIATEANDPLSHYRIHLNPPKNELIQFAHQDKIIVLAEA